MISGLLLYLCPKDRAVLGSRGPEGLSSGVPHTSTHSQFTHLDLRP